LPRAKVARRRKENRMLADTLPVTETETSAADAVGGGADALFVACYRDLRRLAHARLRDGGRDALLDTTALVHESYLRLSQSEALHFPDRPRFLVYAGRVMRSVIIDFARKRQTERRGGDCAQVTLTTQIAGAALSAEQEIVRVHEALEQLAQVDPRMAQVVEMKYFAGLTEVEIAQALGVTDRTVRRDWEQARLFLAEVLAESLR
jgi:RNA polymerase sigma factor (TIGR02999 family)